MSVPPPPPAPDRPTAVPPPPDPREPGPLGPPGRGARPWVLSCVPVGGLVALAAAGGFAAYRMVDRLPEADPELEGWRPRPDAVRVELPPGEHPVELVLGDGRRIDRGTLRVEGGWGDRPPAGGVRGRP